MMLLRAVAVVLLLLATAASAHADDEAEARKVAFGKVLDLSPGQPVALEIPDAGHVVFEPEGGAVQMRYTHADRQPMKGMPVRTSGPGVIHAHLTKTARGIFRFHADHDLLEPNETAEAATPLALWRWTRVALSTPADVDFLTVETPKDGYVTLHAHGVPAGVTPHLHVEASGRDAPVGRPLPLPAGKHLLRLVPRGTSHAPFFVMIRHERLVDDLIVAEGEEPRKLTFDTIYHVNPYASSARRAFQITTERPGSLAIEFLDVPRRQLWATHQAVSNGQVRRISPGGVLPPGDHVINVAKIHNKLPVIPPELLPLRIRVRHQVRTGEGEPENDVPETAPLYPLGTHQKIELINPDVDWYRLELDQPGILQVVSTYPADPYANGSRCSPFLFAEDGTTLLKKFEQGEDSAPFMPGKDADRSMRIEEPGTYYLLFSDGSTPTPTGVGVYFLPDGSSEATPEPSSNLAVAFVDISPSEAERAEGRMMAHGGGAMYTSVDDIATLATSMTEALTTARERLPSSGAASSGATTAAQEDEDSGGGSSPWLVYLLVLLVLGAVIWGVARKGSSSAL